MNARAASQLTFSVAENRQEFRLEPGIVESLDDFRYGSNSNFFIGTEGSCLRAAAWVVIAWIETTRFARSLESRFSVHRRRAELVW